MLIFKHNLKTKEMAKFAEYIPIHSDLRERAAKYYQENKVELPDNDYFNNYFQMPETTPASSEIVESQEVFNAKDFFKRPASKSYDIKESNKSLRDYENIKKIVVGVKDSIAARHNNPGNLMYAGQKGAVKGEARGKGNWAKFNTLEEGWQAVVDDITAKATGKTSTGLTGESTVSDYIGVYAPRSENNTDNYINILKSRFNVDPTKKLKDVDKNKLADGIAWIESKSVRG